jgi:hypothetical protein
MNLNIYTILLCLAVLLGSLTLSAQTTVPNGTFETWTNLSSNTTAGTDEPANWNSNKSGGGNASSAPVTCTRDGNAHSGSYCLKILATTFFGVTVNGIATTGRVQAPDFNAANGYAGTVTNNSLYNTPFTGRPDSLVGWYKYTSAGSNPGTIQLNLHTSDGALPESGTFQGNTTPNVVARAIFTTSTSNTSTWTRFSVPFVYVNGTTPAYLLGVLNTGANNNNALWVDDLEVIYNPALTTGTIATGPYYVSGTTGASVSVPFTAAGSFSGGNTFTAQLSNASGSFASPVTIGSVTSGTSSTIAATIPANTPTGTGYRIRVVSSSPVLTANDNGSNITINLVNTAVTPATPQTLAANVAGNLLTVTETPAASSREWRFATVSGGPYTAFSPAANNTTFAPQFANAGIYYVIAQSTYAGGFVAKSNEVVVTVVGNSIAPSSSQSLLVGGTGNLLTVTETPTGTSREWKYATAPGGPYTAFTPAETGTTYAPLFNSGGTYYVVAQSVINGTTVTSNEVEISVSTVNLLTGTVNPSAFYFSPSAPAASVTVPFSTTSTFAGGNTFTAQLSDPNGNFANATNIGTATGTGSGSINATIPSSTPAGTGYRIRVVASNPAVNGSNNGSNLLIDQFNNSIAPASAQSYTVGSAGTALTVTESQTGSREWKYAAVSGGPYQSFSPPQTGVSYLPAFSVIGTYYVVATSQNQYSDLTTSNEVEVTVVNGTTLSTSTVTGSPFLVSPSSNVQVTIDYTTDIVFGGSNVLSAELSDANGDFTNPVVIGTSPGSSINAIIPSNTLAGTGYRIRVVSTTPAVVGTDNGTDLEVIPFEIALTPLDTQRIVQNVSGAIVTINETHPATRQWLTSGTSGFGYGAFSPAETGNTYTPNFANTGVKYVVVKSVNQWNDTLTSPEMVVIVTPFVGINEAVQGIIKAYWNQSDLMIDLTGSVMENPTMQLFDLGGKMIMESGLTSNSLNQINAQLPGGVYVLQLSGANQSFKVKTFKQ